MSFGLFKRRPRVRVALSTEAIKGLKENIEDLKAQKPLMSLEKHQTREQWRENQMRVLARQPVRPGCADAIAADRAHTR